MAAPRSIPAESLAALLCGLLVAGCLPDMASDAQLRALVSAAAADAQDGAPAGDTAPSDGGSDDALDDGGAGDGAEDGAESDGHDGADAHLDSADDGIPSDGGGLPPGSPCAQDSACGLPVDAPPCRAPICAAGTCALTNAPVGSACPSGGLTLAACQQTRCTASGTCEIGLAPDGASCDADGDGCTGDDLCETGACVVGPLRPCPGSDACAPAACVATGPTTWACQPSFVAGGTGCDDGQLCTIQDACDGAGACIGLPNPCTEVAGPCMTVACDATKDACVTKPKTAGTVCDDDDVCTTPGACTANGTCGGQAALCDDGNACTDDACATGSCQFQNHTGACSDGDACSTGDHCDGKGTCLAGEPRLYDLKVASTPNFHPAATAVGADGNRLVVGGQGDTPYQMIVTPLGNVVAKDATGGYKGAWTAATSYDASYVVGGTFSGPVAATPILTQVDGKAKSSTIHQLTPEAAAGVSVVAVLSPAQPGDLVVVLQRPAVGNSTEVRLLRWDPVKKALVGAATALGGAGDPRVLVSGAHDAAKGRWIFAGRRQLAAAGKPFGGWLLRRNESHQFGGEKEVAAADATFATFDAVAAVPGGYLAGGHAVAKVSAKEQAWLVRLSEDLQEQWQVRLDTQPGDSTVRAIAMSGWGELVAAGVTNAGTSTGDAAALLWRIRAADGVSLLAQTLPAEGGALIAAEATADGYLFAGYHGLGSQRVARVVRTSPWLHATCAQAGGCAVLAYSACLAEGACAIPGCAAGKGCLATTLAAGSSCGPGKTCDKAAICK